MDISDNSPVDQDLFLRDRFISITRIRFGDMGEHEDVDNKLLSAPVDVRVDGTRPRGLIWIFRMLKTVSLLLSEAILE